jgi:L-fucose isomerase-like protein
MASYPWAALRDLDVPVLVWSRVEADPAPRTPQEMVYGSAPVGAAAIANVLTRHGRRFRTTIGPEPSTAAAAWLRAARVAAALRGATFAHLGGDVWPGMLDVALDRDRLLATVGARFVDVEPDWTAGPAPLLGDATDAMGADQALRSQAVAGAIVEACRAIDAGAGAIHCHGAAFAQNPDVGVVCCLAASLLAAEGRPLACTGDDCTAVALFLAQQFGDGAQYLELDAPAVALDACLVTSGGEGDPRMASPDHPVRACENRFFSGVAGRGAAVEFVLRPGPATAIGFTPVGESFRVVAAEVMVADEAPPALGVPRAYVRFAGGATAGFDWWCDAGVNHHLALAPGHHGDALAALAEILGIELRLRRWP